MMLLVQNAMIYRDDCRFSKGSFLIENGEFKHIWGDAHINFDSNVNTTIINAEGRYAIPGLCDIHLHAADGRDFCEGSVDALSAIAHYEARNGITSFCPTSMTLCFDRLKKICQSAADFQLAQTVDASAEAALVGIHLEGPFLSAKKCGAQKTEYLLAPDIALVKNLNKEANGLIRLLTLAPELPGAMDLISELKKDFVISAGHTMADYDTCKQAFDRGITHVTHLYHAMTPFSHRNPGLIGAAFDTKEVNVELICDGIHSDPAAIRMAFKLFSDERIIFISDSMMATGMENGTYTLGEQTVHVKDGLATLENGTIAGSVANLFQCMTKAVNMGIPLESAIRCATMNPAKAIGIYEKTGSMTPGKSADFLLLNPDLSLHSVFVRGAHIDLSRPMK